MVDSSSLRVTSRYLEIVRQEMPKAYEEEKKTFDKLLRIAGGNIISRIMYELGITMLYPIPSDIDSNTIEYCEEAYKHGWAAIIKDGRLLGFQKE